MERNPEVFGLRYRAGFNRWIEQAENDPNVIYHYDPDTRVESWRGGQLVKMKIVQLAMR